MKYTSNSFMFVHVRVVPARTQQPWPGRRCAVSFVPVGVRRPVPVVWDNRNSRPAGRGRL